VKHGITLKEKPILRVIQCKKNLTFGKVQGHLWPYTQTCIFTKQNKRVYKLVYRYNMQSKACFILFKGPFQCHFRKRTLWNVHQHLAYLHPFLLPSSKHTNNAQRKWGPELTLMYVINLLLLWAGWGQCGFKTGRQWHLRGFRKSCSYRLPLLITRKLNRKFPNIGG